MKPEWVAIVLTAIGMLAAFVGVLVKVAVALAANTKAVKDLSDFLSEQKEVNACQDDTLGNHEMRITKIEMVPEVKKAIA